jgi:hypothetical protein
MVGGATPGYAKLKYLATSKSKNSMDRFLNKASGAA